MLLANSITSEIMYSYPQVSRRMFSFLHLMIFCGMEFVSCFRKQIMGDILLSFVFHVYQHDRDGCDKLGREDMIEELVLSLVN